MDAFWVVVNMSVHPHTFSFCHLSSYSAEAEAKRLAEKNPNQDFVVFQACASFCFKVQEVRYENHEEEVPF